MKGPDKDAVMADFAAGRLAVLVATTVIEVGVDVPNATLMIIEAAERFGLAQLHQLRGRVGRGSGQSVCMLLRGEELSWVDSVQCKWFAWVAEHPDTAVHVVPAVKDEAKK
jgi:ATP-dependent DNA helicase RecG